MLTTLQERREIEAALHDGDLWAVAATNALELGVDVGSLDVTLHLGFPGKLSQRQKMPIMLFELYAARPVLPACLRACLLVCPSVHLCAWLAGRPGWLAGLLSGWDDVLVPACITTSALCTCRWLQLYGYQPVDKTVIKHPTSLHACLLCFMPLLSHVQNDSLWLLGSV